MRLKSGLIVVMAILAANSAWAAWVSLDGGTGRITPVTETIRVSDNLDTVLELSVPGVITEETIADGQVFSKIDLPDAGILAKPGAPL
ncbi:MAG TPA: hypothetical protein PLV45_14870 [bacterium]|nr:hypothetical protein [bacterium]